MYFQFEQYVTKQLLITACLNLGHILIGYALGFSSPVLVKLLDKDQSPLPGIITETEAYWIGSSLNLGMVFGIFLSGIVANKTGRKPAIILSSILTLLGQILLAVPLNTVWIYCGQVIKGLGVSGISVVDIVYIGEIASPNIRGLLTTSTCMFHTFGILLVYAVGPFVSYTMVSIVPIIINVIHLICCWYFIPESPVFYAIKDKEEAAKKVLQDLGRDKDIETELKTMIENHKKNSDGNCLQLITIKSNRRALIINMVLQVLNQGGGIMCVLFYSTIIFKNAASSIAPEIASIILGVTQFVGSIVTPFFIDKYGRKTLLLLSFLLCSLFLTILGTYFYLESIKYSEISSIRWLPLFALMTYLLCFSFGVNCIPNVLLGETFRPNMRSLGSSIATILACAFGFITSASFGPMVGAIGSHFAFWIFAGLNFFGFLFTFVVPETKGRSLMEIEAMLR